MINRIECGDTVAYQNSLTYYPILAYSAELVQNGNFSSFSGDTHTIYRWVSGALSLLDTFTDSSYNTATALNVITAQNVIDNRIVLTY